MHLPSGWQWIGIQRPLFSSKMPFSSQEGYSFAQGTPREAPVLLFAKERRGNKSDTEKPHQDSRSRGAAEKIIIEFPLPFPPRRGKIIIKIPDSIPVAPRKK